MRQGVLHARLRRWPAGRWRLVAVLPLVALLVAVALAVGAADMRAWAQAEPATDDMRAAGQATGESASAAAATAARNGKQAEHPAGNGDLPISLQPAMNAPREQPGNGSAAPAVPPPEDTGNGEQALEGLTGDTLHMQPAMPERSATPPVGAERGVGNATPPARAMPAGTRAASAGRAGTAAVPGGAAGDAVDGGARMPVIADVLPHFLFSGLLTGIILALLLMLLAGGRDERLMQRIGAGIFALGALLFVLAYTGAFSVLLWMPPAQMVLVRLATLAEALMLLGAGWWLVAWMGAPQARAARLALMVVAGLALSLILLSPFYPAALLPVVRLALMAVAVAGVAALLWPNAERATQPWGHLALAGLFAWGITALLLTLRLFVIGSATAVLLTAAAITGLAALLVLAALGTNARQARVAGGVRRALQGAEALPLHYEPHSGRLRVPRKLATMLHLPADVVETAEGFFTIVHAQDRPLLEAALRAASLDEPVEMTIRLADGEGVWRRFMLRARAMRTERRGPRVIDGLLLEVSGTTGNTTLPAPDMAEHDVLKTLHDPLTGLPAQALLLDRLEAALQRARRGDGIPCLLILDVDRFRAIIDALGIGTSDLLLVELARRLQGLLNDGETLARLPADQFAMIIDAEQHGTPMSFVRRIREMLAEPFDLDGHEAVITVTIGVVDLVAAMMLSAREAIRAAEIALFEARREGPGREAFYTPDMHGEHARLAKLEQELRRALKTGELEVHYQPVVWLNGRLLAGFEALLRWRHPQRGLIGPEEFLGLAEEIGLMREIGRMVLREAVRQLGIWQRTFRTEYPFYIAVNIASSELLDPALAEEVVEMLARENADAAGLKLEVTEHLLMRDPALARATLTRLTEAGVGVFCDDFGTGHSSLARLRALPFEVLKIDRAFLAHDDAASRGIIAAVAELAHGLSMRVVAEGVEQPWQLAILEELGCDMAQGFLLAEPMDAASILQGMAEARRIAPFSGRMAALSHILLNEQVAPPLPGDMEQTPLPPRQSAQAATETTQTQQKAGQPTQARSPDRATEASSREAAQPEASVDTREETAETTHAAEEALDAARRVAEQARDARQASAGKASARQKTEQDSTQPAGAGKSVDDAASPADSAGSGSTTEGDGPARATTDADKGAKVVPLQRWPADKGATDGGDGSTADRRAEDADGRQSADSSTDSNGDTERKAEARQADDGEDVNASPADDGDRNDDKAGMTSSGKPPAAE